MKRQKFFSLMVIAGILVATVLPFFHNDQNQNVPNFSESSLSVVAALTSAFDDHQSSQSADSHCETCHVFCHLLSASYHYAFGQWAGLSNIALDDVDNGRSIEELKKPPRLFG